MYNFRPRNILGFQDYGTKLKPDQNGRLVSVALLWWPPDLLSLQLTVWKDQLQGCSNKLFTYCLQEIKYHFHFQRGKWPNAGSRNEETVPT